MMNADNVTSVLGVPAVLAAATMAACWIPAQCAAKADPMVVLRYEGSDGFDRDEPFKMTRP